MWCTCAHCGSQFYCDPEDFPKFGGGSSGRHDEEDHVYDTDVSLYFCCSNCWETYMQPIWQREKQEWQAEQNRLYSNYNQKMADCIYIDGAFYSQDKKTLVQVAAGTVNLVIPDGVKYIDVNCLYLGPVEDSTVSRGGKDLVSITMPDSIVYMGETANKNCGYGVFSGCYNLEEVRLSQNLREIPSWAFYGCEKIKKINLPQKLCKIGDNAFSSCRELTEIEFPDGLKEIGQDAFCSCISLRLLKLPDSLQKIGYDAFIDCSSLSSVTLPAHADIVFDEYSSPFNSCSSLTEIVIPEGITKIPPFSNCTSLRKISLPNTTREINRFSGCSSLDSLIIPDGTTDIKDWAFWDCSSLRILAIPASVNEGGEDDDENCGLGCDLFRGCTSLRTIVVTGGTLSPEAERWLKFDIKDAKLKRVKIIYGTQEDAKALIAGQKIKNKKTLSSGGFSIKEFISSKRKLFIWIGIIILLFVGVYYFM